MGVIREYNFNDFINAIKNQVGQEQVEKIDQSSQRLKSIFDIAARTDDGENTELLETDHQGFKDLVNSTLVAFNNMFEKGKNAVKQFEFIPGNSKTKQNGAITPDRMNEYENGELVRTTTGFDDDDTGSLEGNEVETELIAGNWRTKQKGALSPDTMHEYDVNGNLTRMVKGFDENGDGWIDPRERW